MCKYSIIVPVYNAAVYLDRCIKSILCQEQHDFEVILIDDGSTDKSPEICDNYAALDNRIHVIHQLNSGVSSARNAGLILSSGKRIIFVDSDDYIDPNLLTYFDKNSSDLVITGYQIEGFNISDSIKRIFTTYQITNLSLLQFQKLFEEGYFNYVWAKCFSKKIIQRNALRFNSSLSLSEDTLFVLDYVAHCKSIAQISGVPYHYVKYPHETLTGGNLLSEKMIIKIETSNDYIHSSLIKNLGTKYATTATTLRIGKLYKEIMGELLSHPETKKDFITFLFHQKWFRESLNYVDEFYADEDKKFRTLLKTKCGLLFWLYLKLKKFTL